ncbi:hypothetical protein AJ80_02275 [Polytolypa hystricis UAMH7299]|uniref:Jacalin-type lectin domain-containing protein n=1 Tax=Polytolypa hystricis (strain UAMH7299) TaxID=1447883 RepID=A0A2B7YRJ8_POLH7|nr:hypothetical protein AJ80_02275 [Polytolypa hystricis UAMH7299]
MDSIAHVPESLRREQLLPLRDIAHWTPSIPDNALSLNERFFKEPRRDLFKYRPLSFFLFGGPNGIYLKNLARISVWCGRDTSLYGIDFTYNMEIDGQTVHALGRSELGVRKIDFQIDGPGGEVIQAVQIYRKYPYGLWSFEIHTNRDRSIKFPCCGVEGSTPSTHVTVAPSGIITGLYGCFVQGVRIRMESLGVVSEEI